MDRLLPATKRGKANMRGEDRGGEQPLLPVPIDRQAPIPRNMRENFNMVEYHREQADAEYLSRDVPQYRSRKYPINGIAVSEGPSGREGIRESDKWKLTAHHNIILWKKQYLEI